MFRLTKWYLDLVTPQGTVLIAYAGSLRWRALTVDYASTFLAPPGREPLETSRGSGADVTQADENVVRFAHPQLEIDGTWTRRSPPITEVLLDDEAGRVTWDCVLPGARASVRLGDDHLEGLGYVERLTFTRPPWSLPLRTLRWGRFVSDAHALVWISWDGGPPRRWTWLDGVAQPHARPDDRGVSGLDDDLALDLDSGRVLCDRKALQVLSRQLPALDALPLGPLGHLRETKRLDRGRLRTPADGADEGWVIHEVVTW
ncbi:MAG: hypothetical protein KJP18_08195 [Gemmatimonadetes bacterium]|nr:hypothetical protein [Gemmatimonadota bacterium]